MYSTWLSAVFLPVFYIYVGCFIYNSIAWECYCIPECISTAYREVCLLPESSRGYGKCLHEILCLKHTVLYRCFIYASLILCIIYMCQSTIQKTNACMHSAVGTIACISTFIVICPAIFHSLKRIMIQEKVAQPFREFFLNVSWMLI